MGERTVEELRKEINGKQVVWVGDDGLKLDALMIWPPGGDQVSVKPYGYTPEEVLTEARKHKYKYVTIKEVSSPSFCLSALGFSDPPTAHDRKCLENCADLPDGGEYKFGLVVEGPFLGDGRPACPYG